MLPRGLSEQGRLSNGRTTGQTDAYSFRSVPPRGPHALRTPGRGLLLFGTEMETDTKSLVHFKLSSVNLLYKYLFFPHFIYLKCIFPVTQEHVLQVCHYRHYELILDALVNSILVTLEIRDYPHFVDEAPEAQRQ